MSDLYHRNDSVKTMCRRAALLFASASLVSFVAPAFAQQASDDTDGTKAVHVNDDDSGTIVVTAQRREQAVSDIPIAVTAIGGSDLRAKGTADIAELAYSVPNVAMTSFFPSRPEITIRGVSMAESFLSTDQQPVGVYQDEVFLGSRAVHMSQVFDLQRVEIVRGPQGILFGRNTTAGAFSFYSHKPDDFFGGYGQITYGSFGQFNAEGAINVPLGDTVAARVSGLFRSSDGWAKNVNTGTKAYGFDSVALRGQLGFDIGTSRWVANVHYSDFDGNSNFYFQEGLGMKYDQLSQNNSRLPEKIEAFGGNLIGKLSIGDVDVTSITAYESTDYFGIEEFSYGAGSIQNPGRFVQFNPYAAGYRDDYYQISQEIRFSGSSGGLEWIAGVFGYYENVDSEFSDGGYQTGTIGLDFNNNGTIDPPGEGWFPEDDRRVWTQKTKEAAIFAHGHYEISDRFAILGGARLTYSNKKLDWTYTDFVSDIVLVPRTRLERGDWGLSLRAGVEFRPIDDLLLYGRYDKGFKNGGFNVGGDRPEALRPIDPEKVNSFELGAKYDIRGLLQVNMSAFLSKIKNFQVNQSIDSNTGLAFGFTNAGAVETKGIEIEINLTPVENLKIGGGFGYTDSKYTDYVDLLLGADYTGNRLPVVPKFSGSFDISYAIKLDGLTITPSVNYAYTSSMEGRPYNSPFEVLEARNLLDASLRFELEQENVFVQLWTKNLLNEHYRTKVLSNNDPNLSVGFSGGIVSKRGLPRTIGITAGFNF
jgi:iron complex outermembrane receptor protein